MTALAATPVQILKVADIDPSPLNPRHRNASAFSEEKLRRLGESLLSPTGQLEAITVRPKAGEPGRYELANGERRWRAAQLVGLADLAAKVRDLSDADMLEVALGAGGGDNVESLTILEEAEGYQQLMKLRGFDQKQLAAHLGRDSDYVNRALALLHLPEAARVKLQAGELSARTAWLIARIPGETPRAKAAAAILKSEIHGGVMPTRAAEEYILANVCRTLKGAPFDTKSDDLLPEAGACSTCRFRAGNNPEEYGDVGDPLKCMSPDCFEKKLKAHRERVVAKVAVDGRIALPPEENVRVFPPDERGLHYTSDYVPYNERPTPDVLKKEVTPSAAPTWRELVEGGEATVQIYVGVHQDGHAVELVKRSEAIAAADVNERRIFADSEVKRATQRAERGDSIAAADAAAQHETAQRTAAEQSRAAQEKAEAEARKKAEKAQKKKDKASRGLLAELFKALCAKDDNKRAAWQAYPAQSLLFEALRDTLTDEEIAYAVEACDEWSVPADHNREGLNDLSSRLTGEQLGALNLCLALVPRWRAQGADGELATLWAKEIIAGSGDLAGAEGPLGNADELLTDEDPEVALQRADDEAAEKAAALVAELIGYDDAGKSLDEMAYLTHLSKVDVLQILRAQGRGKDLDVGAGTEAEAARAELAAALAVALPDTSEAARLQILGKYIKRVCKTAKLQEELTAEEARKIITILQQARAAKTTASKTATVTTAAELEKEAA